MPARLSALVYLDALVPADDSGRYLLELQDGAGTVLSSRVFDPLRGDAGINDVIEPTDP